MKYFIYLLIFSLIPLLGSSQNKFTFIKSVKPKNTVYSNFYLAPSEEESGNAEDITLCEVYYNNHGDVKKYIEYSNEDTVLTLIYAYNKVKSITSLLKTVYLKENKETTLYLFEYDQSALLPVRSKNKVIGKLNTFTNFYYNNSGQLIKEELVDLIEQPIQIIKHKYDEFGYEIKREVFKYSKADGKEVLDKEYKIEVDYGEDDLIEGRRVYIKIKDWNLMESYEYNSKGKMKEGTIRLSNGQKLNLKIENEINK